MIKKQLMTGKTNGKRNRRMGHDTERYYVQKFKDLGFEHCVTARYGSRLHDDSKIDLIFIPFNVQVKGGFQKGLNYSKALKEMKDHTALNFPKNDPIHTNPKLVIHKKPIGKGFKADEFNELVIMTFDDFTKLIKEKK